MISSIKVLTGFQSALFWGKSKTQYLILILGLSSIAGLVAGILFWLNFTKIAYSLWLGCVAWAIPTACFALRFFKNSGAQAAQKIVKSFYKAELSKWVLTATLFGLIFKYISLEPITFFISFIGMQTIFSFLSFTFKPKVFH